MNTCHEFAHFQDPQLNFQHHQILATLNQLINQLEFHDTYEKNIVNNPETWDTHWNSHKSTLDKVRAIRKGLVDHINHADTKLFVSKE